MNILSLPDTDPRAEIARLPRLGAV